LTETSSKRVDEEPKTGGEKYAPKKLTIRTSKRVDRNLKKRWQGNSKKVVEDHTITNSNGSRAHFNSFQKRKEIKVHETKIRVYKHRNENRPPK